MAKPGSRAARAISHGGKSSGARTIDTSGLEHLAALMVEAQQEIAEAQAEHHLFPLAATQKAVSAAQKTEEWCTRFPGEIAKFRGQLGMQPVPINGSPKQGRQAGYFQMRLRDGTTGYFQRGADDCLQASIASCIQVKPHLVPVLNIGPPPVWTTRLGCCS